jgi:gliding motility-associated-like protein
LTKYFTLPYSFLGDRGGLYLFLIAAFTLFSIKSNAQCTIIAPVDGCKNEIISFDFNTALSYTSVSWTFGDGNNSAQAKPFYQYNTTGKFTINLSLNISGGGTCQASQDITIHDLPIANIKVLTSSNFCLDKNNVILEDLSSANTSTGVMASRLVLWGDGNRTLSNDPNIGKNVSHTYDKIGSYTLDIELINDKGCKIKTTETATILPFYQPSFKYMSKILFCDTTEFCIGNDSTVPAANLKSVIYDWGDGTRDTSMDPFLCHKYTADNTYKITMFATHINGCVSDTSLIEYVNIADLTLTPSMGNKRICVNDRFTFIHPQKPDVTYYWIVKDTGDNIVDTKVGAVSSFTMQKPGKYYITLRGLSGSCEKFYYDSVEVVGIFPKIRILNGNQCGVQDTVYANAYLEMYGTKNFEIIWDFEDTVAMRCTTYVGGPNNNCNFSKWQFAKHKYDSQGCYTIKVYIKDLDNGCLWNDEAIITLKKLNEDDVSYKVQKKCQGDRTEFAFEFIVPECIADRQINYDSACNPLAFTKEIVKRPYRVICSPDGWITVGFILGNGLPEIFRSNDTSDFYIDSSRACRLKFWKHHWFNLNPAPLAFITHDKDSCPPANTTSRLYFPEQRNVVKAEMEWGDGKSDTYNFLPNSDSLGPFKHLFPESGIYYLKMVLTTDSGCIDEQFDTIILGHFSQIWLDPILCPGKPIKLTDEIKYFNDTIPYWRFASRRNQGLETLKWDLGDGNGWSWDKPTPTVTFQNPGIYTVKLATKDINGCRDTLEQKISITGIRAGIKPIAKKIICDDILQLFDSSDLQQYEGLDKIVEYFWDFGDGKKESYLVDPFHFYSSNGNFLVKHAIRTESGCSDTATISISISGPIPDFKIKDTVGCAPFKAEFTNQSKDVSKYIWYYGDPASSTYSTNRDTQVSFTYTQPGIYNIYLFGSDSLKNPDNQNKVYYCSAWFPDSSLANPPVRRVIVLPKPAVNFDLDTLGCLKDLLTLNSTSDPIYDRFHWRINNNRFTSTKKDTALQLTDTGKYIISLAPKYDPKNAFGIGCYDSISKEISIHDVRAKWSFSEGVSCNQFLFSDSSGAYNREWTFLKGTELLGSSKDAQTAFDFKAAKGQALVCLLVNDSFGCEDLVCDTVQLKENAFELILPNVFTPGGDGKNDVFDILITNFSDYSLTIFNRWGEIVYKSSRDGIGKDGINWNGNYMNGPTPLPDGAYFYLLEAKELCNPENKANSISGTVTLIREK